MHSPRTPPLNLTTTDDDSSHPFTPSHLHTTTTNNDDSSHPALMIPAPSAPSSAPSSSAAASPTASEALVYLKCDSYDERGRVEEPTVAILGSGAAVEAEAVRLRLASNAIGAEAAAKVRIRPLS